MRAVVYDLATGAILRVVGCPDGVGTAGQAGDGEGVVECAGYVSDATHRVEGGVVVEV